MVKVRVEPDCGNAPRKELLRELVVCLAERDIERLRPLLSDDIDWQLIGARSLAGLDEVAGWVSNLAAVREVVFGSLLTHGRGASVDGMLHLLDGSRIGFCHVVTFTSAAKSAKIRLARSYIIRSDYQPVGAFTVATGV